MKKCIELPTSKWKNKYFMQNTKKLTLWTSRILQIKSRFTTNSFNNKYSQLYVTSIMHLIAYVITFYAHCDNSILWSLFFSKWFWLVILVICRDIRLQLYVLVILRNISRGKCVSFFNAISYDILHYYCSLKA